jgi:hypothetical protein
LFVRTRFWDAQRARFMPPLVHDRLPASLLERFDGDSFLVRIIQCLRFLGPLTAPPMSRQSDGRYLNELNAGIDESNESPEEYGAVRLIIKKGKLPRDYVEFHE